MAGYSFLPRRHLALLGGTTTLADCLVALGYLVSPRLLLEGPAITRYERAFARRVGARHASSFSTGRVALYGILRALGIARGDEVIVQVPSHIVVANAVRYTGARPVYVDCRLDSYNMDVDAAAEKLTPRTKALILQHTFGIPGEIGAVLDLARRHEVHVIEDCVHALGARYEGRPVGSFGKAAFFSTEETKTISTTMGGMASTDDDDLADRIRDFQLSCSFPSAGRTRRYLAKLILYHLLTHPRLHAYTRRLYELTGRYNPLPGPTTAEERSGERPPHYEQRLSNAQAALGLRQLERLDANIRHRALVAQECGAQLARRGFRTPSTPDDVAPAFVRYPVWVEDRAAAVKAAAAKAVLGTWFTSVLEEAEAPSCGGYEAGSCPVAEAAAQHLVNIPTHQRVRPLDIDAIVSALASS